MEGSARTLLATKGSSFCTTIKSASCTANVRSKPISRLVFRPEWVSNVLVRQVRGKPQQKIKRRPSIKETCQTASGYVPLGLERKKRRIGVCRCSSDGIASVDFVMPDGVSEVYPILLEEKDASDGEWAEKKKKLQKIQKVEGMIERIIFDCRFFALMGVGGSLIGSFLCFVKGCVYVWKSIQVAVFDAAHGINSYKVVLKLIEALDTYLVATVMLIFGMGLYELFVNELDSVGASDSPIGCKSNLFGLFRLQERPKWLQINGLDALKEKLGHVIVMILLVGMFEKSKKVPVKNGIDLLCVAASVLLCAGSLYLLNQLSKSDKAKG